MSVDVGLQYRKGEIKPFYGVINAPAGGTVTLQGGATVTIYAPDGSVIVNAVAVSGQDAGALATARVWYVFATAAQAVGKYYAVFSVQALGSDGITRTYYPECYIEILALIEATYDPALLSTSLLFQTRFHVADTNIPTAVWTDPELLYCLSLTNNVPELAAARALRMAAADAAKLAIISKTDSTSTDLTKLAQNLLASADALEAQCFVAPVVISPDAVFTSLTNGVAGTMDVW